MEWEGRTACVFVRAYPGKADVVYDKIKSWEGTIGLFMTTGSYDIIAWIDTRDIDESYKWITEVRSWPEVERTNTSQTYHGYRNARGYWERPAEGWFQIRGTDLQMTYEELRSSEYVAFFASTAGDYDWIGMFYGEDYNEIYYYIYELKLRGCEIEYYPALKYFWNMDYKEKWEEFASSALQAKY
jgi:hypothetical protein